MHNLGDVRKVVTNIKKRRQEWRVSRREKNAQLVSMLAIPEQEILDEIYHHLTATDYSAGPMHD